MSFPQAVLTVAIAWVVLVTAGWLVVRFLERGPGGNAVVGLTWWATRIYCRIWHRAAFTGDQIIPGNRDDHDGLIIVSNHTGAVDPLLIQARCRFSIRWMMAAETMFPGLDWLWSRLPMIPMSRDGRDTTALREAIRRVRAGEAVGVFPEGRITTPPREIRPFQPGVGLLVTRTRAPVLLVWVSGTPDTNKLSVAFKTRSRARVAFLERIEFPDERDPAAISETLRRRIAEASGWPLNDETLPIGGGRAEESDEETKRRSDEGRDIMPRA